MNLVTGYCRDLGRGMQTGWNRFWFSPADPATLGLIRILAGTCCSTRILSGRST